MSGERWRLGFEAANREHLLSPVTLIPAMATRNAMLETTWPALSATSAQSGLSHTIADERDAGQDCIGCSVGGVDAVAAERM
jgi:hypothetical protein